MNFIGPREAKAIAALIERYGSVDGILKNSTPGPDGVRTVHIEWTQGQVHRLDGTVLHWRRRKPLNK